MNNQQRIFSQISSCVKKSKMQLRFLTFVVMFVAAAANFGSVAIAQESDEEKRRQENFAKFEKMLNNVKLVGSFTILGDDDNKLREEEYVIEKVTKMKEGNLWSFKARIKFGDYDYSAPLPLEVQWAGDTPMITLTDVTIPTLGTFDSRVVFYKGKYAGTWTHGDKGGHLFGRIVKLEDGEGEKSVAKENESKKRRRRTEKRRDDK